MTRGWKRSVRCCLPESAAEETEGKITGDGTRKVPVSTQEGAIKIYEGDFS